MSKLKQAIVFALLFAPLAGPALAQTRVGTIAVSDQGLPYVIRYCEEIAGMSAEEKMDYTPPLSWEVASGVHLISIQRSDCEAAGLI